LKGSTLTTEPLNLLAWRDPKMRWSYLGGTADISCGILVVTDDSVTFVSSQGVEFILPRVGLRTKWRMTLGCVLTHGGMEFLVYLCPPVAGCPSVSQYEADRISAAHLGAARAVTIPTDNRAEGVVSLMGAFLGALAGRGKGSDIGLLVGAFKTRHSRKALKARLR
jgi:hypothetical protein